MAIRQERNEFSARELQTLLLTVGAVSQEQDEEGICNWISDAATSLLGASLAAIALRSPVHDGIVVTYGKMEDAPLSETAAKDVAKLAAMEWPASQRPGRVATLKIADLPPGQAYSEVDHLAKVEVRTIQHQLGSLIVGRGAPWYLDSREQFVLTTLSNHTAVALENVRLRREANERAERQASFNRMIKAITSSLDLAGVFRLLSSEVQLLIAHDRASVALADPGGETATIFATAGQGPILGAGTVVPIAGSMVGQVIETGQTRFRTDLEQEQDFVESPGLLAMGIRSNILAPLREGDVCFGSLNLGSFQVGTYGLDDLSLVQEIADQIAVAVINARLYKDKEASEQHLSRIYEHSNDAIFVIDPAQDEILDFNQRACRMLGYSREDLLSLPISAILPHEMPKLRAFAQSVAQGNGKTDELACTTKRGEVLPVEISASVIEIEGRDCIIAIVRDITDRKEAESTLLELTVMKERSRLAREIHDTLAQSFTAIIWQINAAAGTVEKDSGKASEALERVRDLAREGLQEARRSVWDLRAGPLGGNTLAKALQQETERVTSGRDIRTSVDVLGEVTVLPSGVEAALLRICQESLANILKHAKATQVSVTLDYDDTKVRLTVEDNGIGFDPDMPRRQERKDGGLGLLGMRERARLIGGELTVTSEMGSGTTVDVTLPRK